jgi:hypothetical protein
MDVMLPGAVPAPAEFAMLFSNASKDPTNNNPQTLLNPFLHNINDDTNNMSMENIWDILAVAGHRRYAIAAIIISQGRAYPYLLPQHWEHALTGPEPDLDGKFFTFDGELIKIRVTLSNFMPVSSTCLPTKSWWSPRLRNS